MKEFNETRIYEYNLLIILSRWFSYMVFIGLKHKCRNKHSCDSKLNND